MHLRGQRDRGGSIRGTLESGVENRAASSGKAPARLLDQGFIGESVKGGSVYSGAIFAAPVKSLRDSRKLLADPIRIENLESGAQAEPLSHGRFSRGDQTAHHQQRRSAAGRVACGKGEFRAGALARTLPLLGRHLRLQTFQVVHLAADASAVALIESNQSREGAIVALL